jgi:prepilin-type N-terminal cleavage/methylation domain-containing protein
MQTLKKNNRGFTIIEVMIVLVIAAVIILLVFLAVPALQRNSRNTQRKEDVSKILAAVNEWSTNNNGALPTTAAQQTEALANAQLGIYAGQVQWGTTWPGTVNAVFVAVNQRCASETTLAGQNRSVAALYRVESPGTGTGLFVGTAQQCESS